jgi:hypothetical protein
MRQLITSMALQLALQLMGLPLPTPDCIFVFLSILLFVSQ